jgi:hypothetical protein
MRGEEVTDGAVCIYTMGLMMDEAKWDEMGWREMKTTYVYEDKAIRKMKVYKRNSVDRSAIIL